MIGETRAQVLERAGAHRSDRDREMSRGLIAIFFQKVLGDDDGRVLTAEDQRAVEAAFQAEIDRLRTIASASKNTIEAAQ